MAKTDFSVVYGIKLFNLIDIDVIEAAKNIEGQGFIITINMTCSIDQKLHLLFNDKLHEICIKL